MGGCAFRAKGGTGAAPITSFFPQVPSRMNMLQDFSFGTSLSNFISFPAIWNSFNNLNFLNLWSIYNTSMDGGANANTVSFGAFTTAPDGTNTAQLMVESTNNGLHFAAAGFSPVINPSYISTAGEYGQFHSYGLMRLAGFFKSSNRRIVLELSNFRGVGSSNNNGAQACFNLTTGTVVFSGAYAGGGGFGTDEAYTQVSAHIVPYGNGWYLCWLDVFVDTGTTDNHLRLAAYIDNNTATLGSRPSYTGDGSSGVYGWLTSLLPSRAWGLNSVSFFDDFTTLNTIDGAATGTPTYQPGFNWYNNGLKYPGTDFRQSKAGYPAVPSRGYGGAGGKAIVPANPDWFVVSNSILTLKIGSALTVPPGYPTCEWDGISTLAWNGGGTIPGIHALPQVISGGNSVGGSGDDGSGIPNLPAVYPGPTAIGMAWGPPYYKETKASFFRAGEGSFWTRNAENMFDCFGTTFNDPLCATVPENEMDYFDFTHELQCNTAFGGHDENFRNVVNIFGNTIWGVPDYWYDPVFNNYSVGSNVWHIGTGQFYGQRGPGSAAGIIPPNAPWGAPFTGNTTTEWPTTLQRAAIGSDKDGGGTNTTETLNIYGALVLPSTPNDNGFYLTSFNGVVVGMYTFGPNQIDLGGAQQAGNSIAHLWVNPMHFPINLGSGTVSQSYDYVMVIQ